MPSSAWPVHVDPAHLYFITTRAIQRAHIFQRDVIKRILIDSLNTGRILGQYALLAYVVMPNHIHLILRCLNELHAWPSRGRFQKGHRPSDRPAVRGEGNDPALAFFAAAVPPRLKQRYIVWEHEYQAKNIFSPSFLRQKLDYIHNNPVQPHWRLAKTPELYPWSSARFYAGEGRALLPLSDARELLT